LNLYAFCGNDPVNFVDPLGRNPAAFVLAGIMFLWGAEIANAPTDEYEADAGAGLSGTGNMFGIAASYAGTSLASMGIRNIVARVVAARTVSNCSSSAPKTVTGFIDDVTVTSRGNVVGRGTVDVRATVEGIKSGTTQPRGVFQNHEGLLPKQPSGYYQEFVHPTPGVNGVGPQRIIQGQGGELYYTPNHYESFVPLN
jgi:guanyl-specific ribonuclease Sa